MSLKLAKGGGSKIVHRCCICGRHSEWVKNWSWYGSYLDLEEVEIFKVCSPACQDEFRKTKMFKVVKPNFRVQKRIE